MKKILILLLVAMLMPVTSFAKHIAVEQARQVGVTFLQAMGCKYASHITNRSAELPFGQFYLFAADEGGFVLVATDDCVVPILGYSTTGHFATKEMPAHLADWLASYEEQISFYAQLEQRQQDSPVQCSSWTEPNAVKQQWNRLLQGQRPEASGSTAVAPLLTTEWGQGSYYKALCPYDSLCEERTVTGCVATAVAQVMKYWNYPTTGYGSHSYSYSYYGTQSADFGATTYQWSLMPDSLTSSSSAEEKNAVATLMYHIGVAVEMKYGIHLSGGSGAYSYSYGDPNSACAENALINNFKYSSGLHSVWMDDYSMTEWKSMLTNELVNSRPILYVGRDSTGAHAFVCDGVDSNGLFHFNWGWDGRGNGYFAIGSLNPTVSGAGTNESNTFNLDNIALIGIEPNYSFGDSTTTLSATSNNASYGSVAGGGSYAFGDTVSLLANATTGNRFVRWSDGCKYNPRSIFATGGNCSFTAQFAPLAGDTMSYMPSTEHALNIVSQTSNTYWGIRLPASALTAGKRLTKVQLAVMSAGNYTANIYLDSTSSAPVVSQPFTVTEGEVNTWKSVVLNVPLTVTGTQDLYITFHTSIPDVTIALAYDGGNDDGFLWGPNFQSYRNTYKYSLMICAIFNSETDNETLSYCGDNPPQSHVGTGNGMYWGMLVPPSWQLGHNYLASVELYVCFPGTYHLILAQGNSNAPSTIIPTQSVSFGPNEVNRWHSIPIVTTYVLDTTQPLWVIFYNDDINFPATYCAPNADTNGSWCSTDGTNWGSIQTISEGTIDGTWLIKSVLSNTLPGPNITLSGDVYVAAGSSHTFAAASNMPNATFTWSLEGATPATATGQSVTARWAAAGLYDVVVTATSDSVTMSDTLQVEVYECAPLQAPFTQFFNAPLTDCWRLSPYTPAGNLSMSFLDNWTGSYQNYMVSLLHSNSTGCASRWAFTPAIHLPDSAAGYKLIVKYAVTADNSTPKWGIYAADAPDTSTARRLKVFTSATNNWRMDTLDLTEYAGQTLYLGFCDSSCYNGSESQEAENIIYIESFKVEPYNLCHPQSVPFYCGFESGTDYECWETIDADGDGINWMFLTGYSENAHSGDGVAFAPCFYGHYLTPDDWLILPAIALPEEEPSILSWFTYAYGGTNDCENYEVYLLSDISIDNPPAPVFSDAVFDSWESRSVDLADYAGQTVYIAFRHHNELRQHTTLLIDDISVTQSTERIDAAPEAALRLYPNPTTGKVRVEAEGVKMVRVFDATGRLVRSIHDSCEVDLSDLAPGVYTFSISLPQQVIIRKVVKK